MLDLSGFVSPANTFEGLDNMTNTLIRNKQLQRHDQQEKDAKAAASTKFFTNYLDEKQKFTGTKYDPINHQLLSDALNDATQLIQQGANETDILAAISPKVNKAAQYTVRAQTFAANKKAFSENLHKSGAKGIDYQKLDSQIDKEAFPDGVDVSTVDPNVNYGDMALKNGDVYNTEALDDAFIKAPKNTEIGTVKYTNKKGGIQRDKVKLTAPYYAVSEKDADGNHIGFAPKFQTAKDEGNEIIHQWDTEHGKVDAPIRLYDEDLFNSMSAGELGPILQETRKYAKEKGVDLTSVQAKNFARALAYNEKKSRINGTYEHVEETKDNPAPRISVHVGGGETKSEQKAKKGEDYLHTSLDETPVDPGTGLLNATQFIKGVKVFVNSRGKEISQPSVYFNPKDKTFTYVDPETNKSETVSFAKFRSMAATNNPQSDMNFLEGFKSYERKTTDPKKEDEPKNFADKVIDFFKGNTNTDKPKTAAPKKKDTLGIF